MLLLMIISSLIIAALSGLPSVILNKKPLLGRIVSVVLVSVASAAGLISAIIGLVKPTTFTLPMFWDAVGGTIVGLDPLSAFFLVPIFLIGGLGSIYGMGYISSKKETGRAGYVQFFGGS